MTKTVKPFATWPSPVTPEMVSGKSLRFGLVRSENSSVYWTESRPAENGRSVLMKSESGGIPEELLPSPYSARSLIHEYGGGEFLLTSETIYFINHADQDIYSLSAGNSPIKITDEPSMRFADMALDQKHNRLIAVSERYTDETFGRPPQNLLSAIDLNASFPAVVSDLIVGHDFFACPRISPDGARLAYLAWDRPDMPWDSAALYLADIKPDGTLGITRQIAGGDGCFIFQPEWESDNRLYFVSDTSGWGNLYCYEDNEIRQIADQKIELNRPMWTLGMQTYCILSPSQIALSYFERGDYRLAIVDPYSGTFSNIKTDLRSIEQLNKCGSSMSAIASTDHSPPSVVTINIDGGSKLLRASSKIDLSPGNISVARRMTFYNRQNEEVFGRFYAPTNENYQGPPEARPPAILLVHGGPTGISDRGMKLKTQFWTSRGFSVFDIDYSGSTGYGRAYRDRLDGKWGIHDVADIIDGAMFLVKQRLVDQDKLFISGGSAGGFTILMALAGSNIFSGAACYYGVTDLEQLLKITHKFESGYLYRLLGVTRDEKSEIFKERSPLSHVQNISTPIIFFQGLNDKVVPPGQSRSIVSALKSNGRQVEYVEFEGEGHGFRSSIALISALEKEYAFFKEIVCGPET